MSDYIRGNILISNLTEVLYEDVIRICYDILGSGVEYQNDAQGYIVSVPVPIEMVLEQVGKNGGGSLSGRAPLTGEVRGT